MIFWITRAGSSTFVFDGGVGLEGNSASEESFVKQADKRETVGLGNPLKDSEAVVEESGGGSKASRNLSTTTRAILSLPRIPFANSLSSSSVSVQTEVA